MVQQPQLQLRALHDVEPVGGRLGLHQPEQVKRAVQRADFRFRCDDRDGPILHDVPSG